MDKAYLSRLYRNRYSAPGFVLGALIAGPMGGLIGWFIGLYIESKGDPVDREARPVIVWYVLMLVSVAAVASWGRTNPDVASWVTDRVPVGLSLPTMIFPSHFQEHGATNTVVVMVATVFAAAYALVWPSSLLFCRLKFTEENLLDGLYLFAFAALLIVVIVTGGLLFSRSGSYMNDLSGEIVRLDKSIFFPIVLVNFLASFLFLCTVSWSFISRPRRS
jgi:hypothetical protein